MFSICAKLPLPFGLGMELQVNGETVFCTKLYYNKEFTHPYVYEFGRA